MLEVRLQKQLGQLAIDVAFSTGKSGITVLFGHSGAGKTSLVNMMAGLLKPDSGRVCVNDRVLFDSAAGLNLPPEKRRCGYIFQDKRLFPYLSVKGNLLFAGAPADTRKFTEIVDFLGLGRLLDRKPIDLSGGEVQRVAIGRVLLSSPDFLLMDEPMSSLDSGRKEELIPYLSRLAEVTGIPIVLVTHAYDELLRLADQAVFMNNGKSVAVKRASELLVQPDGICPFCPTANYERERPQISCIANKLRKAS